MMTVSKHFNPDAHASVFPNRILNLTVRLDNSVSILGGQWTSVFFFSVGSRPVMDPCSLLYSGQRGQKWS
jgi:hypothetical protein